MPKRAPLSLISALAVGAMALAGAQAASATTETFNYTGAAQTWTVPAGVTSATFDLYGAAGYSSDPILFAGGKGGRATATLSVTPGDQVQITVGGAGAEELGIGTPGFNGGGGGRFPGGGATDVRIGGTALTDRVLVAGGGGGPAGCAPGNGSGVGGAGGGLTGGDGAGGCMDTVAGTGGTQSAGGSSGGSLGQGGDAPPPFERGGGGGGGYYGGGAGTTTGINGGGGGGGSGYGPQGTDFETGVREGDGMATVTYTGFDPPPAIDGMRVVPRSFAPAATPTRPRRLGAKIEISLSEQASVRFRVRSDPVGRSSRPGARPRAFTRSLPEGDSSIPFTGAFRRKLKPGRYQVFAIATDSAGQRSDKARAKFRVKG